MSLKLAFSVAGEKGRAFLLIFQKLGGVTAFEKLEYTEKKSHIERKCCSLLCVFFFFFLHLLPLPVCLASYLA